MRFKLAVAAVALTLCGAAPAQLAPRGLDISFAPLARGAKNEIMPGLVLVKLPLSQAARAQKLRRLPVSDIAPTSAAASAISALRYQSRIAQSGWTLWRLPKGADIPQIAETLKHTPGIVTAQPVHRVYALLPNPNDPDFYVQEDSSDLIFNLGEDPIEFRRLWHLDEIFAFEAWSNWPNVWYTAATKPADAPLIAVIDTGCDMDHPDFINAGGTGTDVGQGGQFVKSLSAQFELGEIIEEGDETDIQGHGTHVTGLALAAGNNGSFVGHGVIGTGYNARGMILRIFNDQGIGTDADAAAAIFYAADNGAEVINLSLGTTSYSQLFQDAVSYAFQKGSLVVCAGNENGSGGGDLGPIYPAACSGALAVAASGPDFSSTVSVYGGTGNYLDIAAPGGSVIQGAEFTIIQFAYSTSTRYDCTLTDLSASGILYPPYTLNFSYLAGTSMACPIVSGAAALYMGKFDLRQQDGWSNMRTYRAIERSANGFAPYGTWEFTFGYGILSMEELMTETNTRGAIAGGAEGIVYYNGTPVANVAVKAKKIGTTRPIYSTTTRADGMYRFEALTAGTYEVTARPFGALKTKRINVVPGTDQTAVDFWCGTYFADDETGPEVPIFQATRSGSTLNIRHWAYDTETGIDSMVFRVGTTTGGADIRGDTHAIPDNNQVSLTGLSLTAGVPYYLRGTYVNGAGMTRTVDVQFNASGPSIGGTVTLEDWNGGQTPVTLELRTPGSTTALESHNVMVNADGTFTLRLTRTGTFDVAVKGPHWLRKKIASVVIPAGGVSGLNFQLVNGDVDFDNRITMVDYSRLSKAFGTRPGEARWLANADVNGDLYIDQDDYDIVRRNYRKNGDP